MIDALNRHIRRRRSGDSGFTLIELLVVIVILGVLSAIVVFAVRGAGDKGSGAAYAIDARTIRTAQEAYCGQNGRYASGEELVAARLLSELPTYHQTAPAATTSDSNGNCNGAGDPSKASYYITCDATKPGCGNGGATKLGWQQQVNPSPAPTGILRDITFVDTQRGWAVGAFGRILATTNGGATWSNQTSGTSLELWDVDFVDATHGWAVGFGIGVGDVILATTDGGNSWVPKSKPAGLEALQFLDGMEFVNGNRGWIGGTQGGIIGTVDGGNTWAVEQPRVAGQGAIRTIHCLEATRCWAGTNGLMMYHYDGVAWTSKPFPFPTANGVKFVSPSRGWAVGSSKAFATTDGGLTWNETHDFGPTGSQQGQSRQAVDFVNDRLGWTVGGRLGGTGPGAALVTADGGVTWKDSSPPPSNSGPQGVDFIDAAHGWAAGSGGQIHKYGPVP